MRYSVLYVFDENDYYAPWLYSHDLNEAGDPVYPRTDWIEILKKGKSKFIREHDGLEYYREPYNDQYMHFILIPETHPLFNFYIMSDGDLWYRNMVENTSSINFKKYVAPLIKEME